MYIMEEEIRKSINEKLKDDRITVHPGEFRVEKLTKDTHSLSPDEYKQARLEELKKFKECLKKKISHIK